MLSKFWLKRVLYRHAIPVADSETTSLLERLRLPDWENARQALLCGAHLRHAAAERFIELCRAMTPALEDELRQMKYRDFLDTDYWNYLRDYLVMVRGLRCEACGCMWGIQGERFQLHHTTYRHRGCEWRHPRDLQVLCPQCHASARLAL